VKRSPHARVLALAARLVLRATVWLLGARHAAWGRAMQAEVEAVDDEREALALAWGCLRAAVGQAFAAPFAMGQAPLAQAQNAGACACLIAVVLGGAFMHGAGAPGHYAVMNVLSLAFALVTFRLLPRKRLAQDDLLRAQLSLAIGAWLLLASLFQADGAASAWLRIGPVHLNLTWLLLPALLLGSDVRPTSAAWPWGLAGLLMASGALALLSDPVLAALVAAVLGVRAWLHRSGLLALLAVALWAVALRLGHGWQPPQALPFVDRVLHDAFAQGLATGLALVVLQVMPLWPALRNAQARQLGLVWGLLVLLSLPGWLPSPLVGFGGSFIVGYLLSLAMLPSRAARRPAGAPAPLATGPRQAPPRWPRSGLT
jgi:hypothetical protein